MEIGELIQQARERRGWTRSELAAKAGISAASITRIETGERTGYAETIARIARSLELSAEEVFTVLLGEGRTVATGTVTVFDQVAELIRRIERLEGTGHSSDDVASVGGRVSPLRARQFSLA